jgi:hypothetical protein
MLLVCFALVTRICCVKLCSVIVYLFAFADNALQRCARMQYAFVLLVVVAASLAIYITAVV